MKGFRIGYILSASFLFVITLGFVSTGFFPAPVGPKPPQFPTTQGFSVSNSTPTTQAQAITQPIQAQPLPGGPIAVSPIPTPPDYSSYQQNYDQYTKDQEQYKKDQETFMQNEMLPYIKNMFIIWIATLVVFQVLGIFLAKRGSELAGGALCFTGIWGFIFGPFLAILFFAVAAVPSAATRAGTDTFATQTFSQNLALVGIVGSVIILLAGLMYDNGLTFLKKKSGAATF